jgi:hypothetical protein
VNHLPEDPLMVPIVIRHARADYRASCLMCVVDLDRWRASSEIIYFF